MAQGEALRPLETTDGKSVDRQDVLGNSSLTVADLRSADVQSQILTELRKIRFGLELLLNETIDEVK